VADPKIWKRGVEDNLSALSSFIANAHNDLQKRKKWIFGKNVSQWEWGGGGRPHCPPLNPPLCRDIILTSSDVRYNTFSVVVLIAPVTLT